MHKTNKMNVLLAIDSASAYVANGDLDRARHAVSDIFSVVVDGEMAAKLGNIHLALNEPGNAVRYFAMALSEKEDDIAYTNLANAYLKMNSALEAEGLFKKAIEINPSSIVALMNLGALLIRKREYAEAKIVLSKALEIKPGNTDILANLSLIYSADGDHENALYTIKKSLQKNPKNPNALVTLGSIYVEMGDIADAITAYEKAILLDRRFGQAYCGLSVVKKYTNDDLPVIRKYESVLRESMRPDQRSHIHFALGKIYDDIGDYECAFGHYRQANLLSSRVFDHGLHKSLFRELRRVFTARQIKLAKELGDPSDVPVFIVGMPRSGTTLIEQIISSHPDACGAGELFEIERIEKRMCEQNGKKEFFVLCKNNLNKDELSRYAKQYLDVLYSITGEAARIVDKMPENYLFLGLIHTLFPSAKIIHSLRNPLDTCLSCYFQSFQQVDWAFDLNDIGKRYHFYREVMEYWYSALPEGVIINVCYENVIEHPEEESRRIIDFIGLPWDESCLSFNRTDRAVRTASMWQVRQPIYKTSKMRARHYAKHLTGLANKLQKYLPDDPEFRREFGIKKRWFGLFG